MKRLLLFSITILLFSNISMAQDFDIHLVTDKLQATEIITEVEKAQLIESSNRGFMDGKIKTTFLYNLGNIYLTKYLPDPLKGIKNPMIGVIGPNDFFKKDTTEAEKNRTKLINQQLIELDLIDETIYNHWVKESQKVVELNNDAAMIMFYAAQVLELEDKNGRQTEATALIEKYKANNWLSDDFKEKEAVQEIDVKEPIDLIGYFENGITIEVRRLPKTPKEGYVEIFKKINDAFDGINLTLLDFAIDRSEKNKLTANIKVSANNRIYTDTIYYNYYGNRRTFDDVNVTSIANDIINIVNEILYDSNSAYKFYAVSVSSNSTDKHKGGYLFLEKNRYHEYVKNLHEFRITGPHPAINLNKKMVQIYEQELIEVGLIESPKPAALRDSIQQFNDFFSHYNITRKISFLINEQRNHTTVLKEISDIIGEEFQITPISEVWDTTNASIHLAFLLNGKKEEMDLTIYERKNDKVFLDRKNELLQEANLKKKFVSLGQQTGPRIGFGYFTEAQIEWIKLNGDWIYPAIYNK